MVVETQVLAAIVESLDRAKGPNTTQDGLERKKRQSVGYIYQDSSRPLCMHQAHRGSALLGADVSRH